VHHLRSLPGFSVVCHIGFFFSATQQFPAPCPHSPLGQFPRPSLLIATRLGLTCRLPSFFPPRGCTSFIPCADAVSRCQAHNFLFPVVCSSCLAFRGGLFVSHPSIYDFLAIFSFFHDSAFSSCLGPLPGRFAFFLWSAALPPQSEFFRLSSRLDLSPPLLTLNLPLD